MWKEMCLHLYSDCLQTGRTTLREKHLPLAPVQSRSTYARHKCASVECLLLAICSYNYSDAWNNIITATISIVQVHPFPYQDR